MKNTLTWIFRDGLFGFLLRILWEPFSKKRSHWWHWQDHSSEFEYMAVSVPADLQAKPRNTFWSMLWQTNFGWTKVVIVSPYNKETPFHICFISSSERVCQRCSLVNEPGVDVGLLVGPGPMKVFAVGPDGQPLKLEVIRFTRKASLNPRIRLL